MIRRAKINIGSIAVPQDAEYLSIVQDILENPKVSTMREYVQHGNTSCLEHSINVSYLSYLYCKKHKLNASAAARAGLLHDLFLYDWHLRKRKKGEQMHGFSHPRTALQNAQKTFKLTALEENIILRHMWPLTTVPPKYAEAYVVVWLDKYCSVMETVKRPVMQLYEKQEKRIEKSLAQL